MATKEDWLEYFEMMNDRKPSLQEYQEALRAGEISEEQPRFEEKSDPIVPETLEENPEEIPEEIQDESQAEEKSQENDPQFLWAKEKESSAEACHHENLIEDELMGLSGKRYILHVCAACGKIWMKRKG